MFIFHWNNLLLTYFNSLFKSICKVSIFLTARKTQQKNWCIMISFRINRRNNSGPTIEPWETPASTLAHKEYWPFNTTIWVLLSKAVFIEFKRSKDLGAILCQMLLIYQEILPLLYFVAVIKWLVYSISDKNRLDNNTRVISLETNW